MKSKSVRVIGCSLAVLVGVVVEGSSAAEWHGFTTAGKIERGHATAAAKLVNTSEVATEAVQAANTPPRPLPKGWEWRLVGVDSGSGPLDDFTCAQDAYPDGFPFKRRVACAREFVPQHECGVKVYERGADGSYRHGRSAKGEPGVEPDALIFKRERVPNPVPGGLHGCQLTFQNAHTDGRSFLLVWPSQTRPHDPWVE